MNKLPISIIIAVKNEYLNLKKSLPKLKFAERIILVDSESTDSTQKLAKIYSVELVQFKYKKKGLKKRQWALNSLNIKSKWIMLIDADEIISKNLRNEIQNIILSNNSYDAYMIKKDFHFLGKRMAFGGFSFDAVVLFKKGKAKFEQILDDDTSGLDMEVHERMIVKGKIGKLKNYLIHQDFKNLQSYLSKHNYYSSWKAHVRIKYYFHKNDDPEILKPNLFGNTQERRRWLDKLFHHIPFEHWIWFVYHYFLRLGFLEGRRGLIACRIRANYIADVNAKVYEYNLKK